MLVGDLLHLVEAAPAHSSADVWRLNMDAKGKKEALAKIWSDNSLRVMDDVQGIATKLRKEGMLANDQAGSIAPNVGDAQPGPRPKPVPGTFSARPCAGRGRGYARIEAALGV